MRAPVPNCQLPIDNLHFNSILGFVYLAIVHCSRQLLIVIDPLILNYIEIFLKVIMKKACSLLLFFIHSVLFAQTDPSLNLPQLLPPTPEAAQLVKVGLGGFNKSSGAVQVALPLYELKVGGVKLPITLNYLSRAIKLKSFVQG
jgi:hypothetical protein